MADDSLPEKLHPETILRFEDLMTLRVVRSRATLAYWIQQGNFPCGRWIGENTRAWTWGEVQQWIASRPTNSRAMPKPLHKATGRKPKRKEQQTTKQAERRTTKQSGAERSRPSVVKRSRVKLTLSRAKQAKHSEAKQSAA